MFSTLFSTTLWKTVEKQWKSREGMWERFFSREFFIYLRGTFRKGSRGLSPKLFKSLAMGLTVRKNYHTKEWLTQRTFPELNFNCYSA